MRMMGIKSRLRWSRPHIGHCAKMSRNSKSCFLLHKIRIVEQQVGHCVVLCPDPECSSEEHLSWILTISHSAIKPNIKPCNYCAAGVVLVQEDGGSCSHPWAVSNYHCATLSPDPLSIKVSTKFCRAQYLEKPISAFFRGNHLLALSH